MIELRLFGDLVQHAGNDGLAAGTAIYVSAEGGETVGQVLEQMGIGLDEVGNVFLNGRLLPRSTYPITLGYQLTAPEPLTSEECLGTPVRTGDRLGVFPLKMASVVV